jgi:hypothetical protein
LGERLVVGCLYGRVDFGARGLVNELLDILENNENEGFIDHFDARDDGWSVRD